MKHRILVAILLGVLPGLFLSACAPNPADDVPAAQMDDTGANLEATPETAVVTVPADVPIEGAGTQAIAGQYPLTGTLQFAASKVTATHLVEFKSWQGTYESDGTLVGTSLNFSVDLASLVADEDNRGAMTGRLEDHLKSADFFDVAAYPTATFASTAIVEGVDAALYPNAAGATHTVSGVLDIHGSAREVSFPATITDDGAGTIGARAEFAVDRQDFGLVYPGAPDDLIRDEVVIKIDARLVTAG